MNKIFIMIMSLLAVLGIIFLAIFISKNILVSKISGRHALAYTEAELTHGTPINNKMIEVEEKGKSFLTFSPEISNVFYADGIGLVADSPEFATQNAQALNKVIEQAKSHTQIVIPAGKYYIDSSIILLNKKNITITGDSSGVEFVNTSYSPFIPKSDK